MKIRLKLSDQAVDEIEAFGIVPVESVRQQLHPRLVERSTVSNELCKELGLVRYDQLRGVQRPQEIAAELAVALAMRWCGRIDTVTLRRANYLS